jgi:hypothetical protein
MRFTLGKLVLLAAAAAVPCAASASTVVQSGYTYTITLDGPTGNTGTLTMNDDLPLGNPNGNNTYSITGNPAPDSSWAQDDTSFIGNNDSSSDPTQNYTEILIQWENADDTQLLAFTITEPDDFWAIQHFSGAFPGPAMGYPATYSGYSYDDANGLVPADVPVGAYYGQYVNDVGSDPPCCSITTSYVPPVNATPEPSTMTLLGTGGAAILGVYRRRRRA